MSAHWREVSKHLATHQLVIPRTIEHLSNKIALLRYWRGNGTFRSCSVCFIVSAPVKLNDLANLLEHLTRQVELSGLLVSSVYIQILAECVGNLTHAVCLAA